MKNQKGFTLLELLIYLVLLALLSLVVSSTFLAILRGQVQVEMRSEVNTNLRFALDKISYDLRRASAVNPPTCLPSGDCSDSNPNATSSTLVLTIGVDTITYDVLGGELRRQVNAATPEAVTSNRVSVAIPTFKRLENSTGAPLNKTVVSIQINLTVSSASTASEKTFSANKKTTTSLY